MSNTSIFKCDNCHKQQEGSIYPSDWFHVTITEGMSWHNAVEKVIADYCCHKCMVENLLKYLGIKLLKRKGVKTDV